MQPAIGRLFGAAVFKRNQRCCEPGDRSKRIPTGSRMQWNSGSNSSLRACVEVYPRPAHRVACVVSQGVPAWWLYFSVLNAQAQLTPAELRERMSGNICRCGAYSNIVDAITEVSGSKT